jgi:hypothetical protein
LGTELHDKFYYLIFAYLDMIDVVNDLKILDITLIFLGLIHSLVVSHHGNVTIERSIRNPIRYRALARTWRELSSTELLDL